MSSDLEVIKQMKCLVPKDAVSLGILVYHVNTYHVETSW